MPEYRQVLLILQKVLIQSCSVYMTVCVSVFNIVLTVVIIK